jgi:hypothetical protein
MRESRRDEYVCIADDVKWGKNVKLSKFVNVQSDDARGMWTGH